MKTPKAVAQFFYHCVGEELPIRDILDTQNKGPKTEPHYENLTENWCSECMNARIKSANRNKLDYLFLFTRYKNEGHKHNNKYFVVGYLKRASSKRWIELNKTLKSGVEKFSPKNPETCGFFAGSESESKFVSIEQGYFWERLKNGRYLWYINEDKVEEILAHISNGRNIINDLRKRAEELKKEYKKLKKRKHENSCSSCRNR